ncbi:MAG: DUF6997 domain-containing protein, partial [Nitrososphaerales archaeon]
KKVAIVRGKGFEPIEEFKEPVQTHTTAFAFPEYLKKSRGEANFVKYAFRCGLFTHFTGKRGLGSEYAAKSRPYFTFRVDGQEPLKVEGVQIELDDSYGNDEVFYTVEAKYTTPSSFNIRQIYYPYRAFVPEVKPREVKNLFFAYEPKVSEFRFWEYAFRDPDDYEQIELVRRARYKIQFTQNPTPLKEYAVQPDKQMKALQANNVFFLMDVPRFVFDGIDDTAKIAQHLGVDRRQGQYNASAMKILGFIEDRGEHKFKLTNEGEEYIKLEPEEGTKYFVKRLMENPLVSEALRRILSGETLTLPELKEITKKNDLRIDKDTVKRRAECLFAYFKFIAEVMGYLKVQNGVISLLSAKETLNGYR